MSDTKALDHFFDNGNWQSGDDGDWQYEGTIDPQQAAKELRQLQYDASLQKVNEDTNVMLMSQNVQLRAELDEWENAKKFVADGCKDELHCGCVPILKRELDEAKIQIDVLRAEVKQLCRDY